MSKIPVYETEFHLQKVLHNRKSFYFGGFDVDGSRWEIRGENLTEFYSGLISNINNEKFCKGELVKIKLIFELMQRPEDEKLSPGSVSYYPLVDYFPESEGYKRKTLEKSAQEVVKGILGLHNRIIDMKDFVSNH